MKTQNAVFTDIKTLKSFEHVSSKVSAKYVPIYTSEVIKALEPEFTFIEGMRYNNYKTMHSVYLENDLGDKITIDNSYDRTRAFGFRFHSDGLAIPLNLDRQIHIGQHAQELADNLIVDKQALVDAIQNAKNVVQVLRDTPITQGFKDEIISVIFKKVIERNGFKALDIVIADSYDNFYSFIVTAVARYLKGDYTVTMDVDGREVTRKGHVIKSRFQRLYVTNDVYGYLEEERPEVFV